LSRAENGGEVFSFLTKVGGRGVGDASEKAACLGAGIRSQNGSLALIIGGGGGGGGGSECGIDLEGEVGTLVEGVCLSCWCMSQLLL